MEAQIKKKWLEALRSGEYKQCKGSLKNNDGYCCLGVLTDLYRLETKIGKWDAHQFVVDTKIFNGILPPEVVKWSGVENENPNIDIEIEKSIAELNDESENFIEVANVIEKQF